MSDELVVICVPWDQAVVEGSTKAICQWCEAICAVSPATLKGAKEYGEYHIMCDACFRKNTDMSKPLHIKPVTPEQIKEMRKALGGGE